MPCYFVLAHLETGNGGFSLICQNFTRLLVVKSFFLFLGNCLFRFLLKGAFFGWVGLGWGGLGIGKDQVVGLGLGLAIGEGVFIDCWRRSVIQARQVYTVKGIRLTKMRNIIGEIHGANLQLAMFFSTY